MSVDKFGHHAGKKVLMGPKGTGFNLTPEGDYDICGHILHNVGDPKETMDAASKAYVDARVPTQGPDIWKFGNKRLSNVGDPIYEGEAVNMRTLQANCLQKKADKYDAQGKRLTNLASPMESTDAVTRVFFEKGTPIKLAKSYSVHQFRIQDLGAPKDDGDAVNLKTLNSSVGTQSAGLTTRLNSLEPRVASLEGAIVNLDGKLKMNRKIYEKQLRKFGSLLFRYIHRGRSATTAGEDNYLDWTEIFSVGS